MSVVNEFDCIKVGCSKSIKTVYMQGMDGSRYPFPYNIETTANLDIIRIKFYFCMKTSRCLIMRKEDGFFKCAVMKYWIIKDSPVLAVQYFNPMDRVMTAIDEEFKDQYASIVIDDAINS